VRYRVVEELGRYLVDGTLSVEEFDERVGRILESPTMGELAAVVDDLPLSEESIYRETCGLPAGAVRIHVHLCVLLAAFWIAVWQLSTLRSAFSPALPVAGLAFSLAVHWTLRRLLRR
jgi:hypothetical protein